ncbi:MAG: hypothetical protein JXR60_01195 [Bacteroidales bacterium]|nr:hypothetical protein [Bacteroidales bacterium]
MFYNLENLFDIYDDTTKWDEQFLPDGDKHWTANKYETKLKNIAKVITAVGGWQTPAIIGVCEVENLFVLEELTERSPIAKLNYQIIHKESPDNRGIDVALLYQSDDFTPLYYDFIPIHFPNSPQSKTRDILYAKGLMKNKDTLHVFVNHWPSRWGGQMKTENKRIYVAETLRKKVDSLYQTTQNPNIVIMGDFNDTPTDKSILEYLKGMPPEKPYSNSQLYNLMYPLSQTEEGTHPYQGHWAVLDQFIVSGGLINGVHQTEAKPENAYPFKADFLLEDDTKYGGKKTNRSYIGFKYNGGYSDHLPIVLDLDFR